ncbi:hypothetical protein ACFLZY_00355 [Patescibacteria group bacterium]
MLITRILLIVLISVIAGFVAIWMQEARREHDEHLRRSKTHFKTKK